MPSRWRTPLALLLCVIATGAQWDFVQTLALFAIISAATVTLAGSFAANLLHDVYADRRGQCAMLLALGFSPMQTTFVELPSGSRQ